MFESGGTGGGLMRFKASDNNSSYDGDNRSDRSMGFYQDNEFERQSVSSNTSIMHVN